MLLLALDLLYCMKDSENDKKDIEKSHQDYLKELKFIPDMYAHTFGETSVDLINLIKKFNYKIIFGQ